MQEIAFTLQVQGTTRIESTHASYPEHMRVMYCRHLQPTIADAATMVCVENKSADSQGLSRQEEGTDELPVLSDMLDSVLDCHSRLCTITEETKVGTSGMLWCQHRFTSRSFLPYGMIAMLCLTRRWHSTQTSKFQKRQ